MLCLNAMKSLCAFYRDTRVYFRSIRAGNKNTFIVTSVHGKDHRDEYHANIPDTLLFVPYKPISALQFFPQGRIESRLCERALNSCCYMDVGLCARSCVRISSFTVS